MTPHPSNTPTYDESVDRFPFSHFFRTIETYRKVIVLAVVAAAVGYIIFAVAYWILAPAQRVTTLPFRLEFKGAEQGQYPNGTKFSPADVISAPVLHKTFQENDLGRFTSFQNFAGSLFVVESNPDRDKVAREYQARLSDMRLSAVDRDRIQREYELKLASLSKNLYALNYTRKAQNAIPETALQETLHDVLRNWAEVASTQQHVLEYRVPILSPDVVAARMSAEANPVITMVTMRARILRLLENIVAVQGLPNADLVRTSDGLALSDIALRLDDLVRYRLEPLVERTATAGLDNRIETVSFLSSQLSYDERQLEAQRRIAESAHRTLSVFMNAGPRSDDLAAAASTPPPARAAPERETVMPQLNETFLERLIDLTSSAADSEFRKYLSEEYRTALLRIVPLEQAVAYDRRVLETIRNGAPGGPGLTREAVARDLEAMRLEVRQLALKVHEIHRTVSRNLNPSTQLVMPSAPRVWVDRAVSLKRLLMFGILVCTAALGLAVVGSLVHNRVREEEDAERTIPAEAT